MVYWCIIILSSSYPKRLGVSTQAFTIAHSAGAVEYTDCFSAEG